jgi:hypothetical protein
LFVCSAVFKGSALSGGKVLSVLKPFFFLAIFAVLSGTLLNCGSDGTGSSGAAGADSPALDVHFADVICETGITFKHVDGAT